MELVALRLIAFSAFAGKTRFEERAMATVVHEQVELPLDGLRISWGGIWAGVLTVLGTLLFLTTLGLAIGISAVDPGSTDASTVGMGAVIWSALSLLIALFIGGMAATRLGLVFDKAAGAFEGALVWVLSFMALLWLASSGVQLIGNGISGLFSGATRTISTAAGGVGDLSSGDVNQILARLNDPGTARMIASATGMAEQEVSSTLRDVSQRVEAARDNPQAAAEEVRRGTQQLMDRARQQLPVMAERAQAGASKTAWATFAALVVSLAAAITGAMMGRKRVVRRLATPGDDVADEMARASMHRR
jgi:methyl-accepting chemotaxis protein